MEAIWESITYSTQNKFGKFWASPTKEQQVAMLGGNQWPLVSILCTHGVRRAERRREWKQNKATLDYHTAWFFIDYGIPSSLTKLTCSLLPDLDNVSTALILLLLNLRHRQNRLISSHSSWQYMSARRQKKIKMMIVTKPSMPPHKVSCSFLIVQKRQQIMINDTQGHK